jgi:hypothetical protein
VRVLVPPAHGGGLVNRENDRPRPWWAGLDPERSKADDLEIEARLEREHFDLGTDVDLDPDLREGVW